MITILNPVCADFVLKTHKHVFVFYIIPPHWKVALMLSGGRREPAYLVNNIAADDWLTQNDIDLNMSWIISTKYTTNWKVLLQI